jgi:hypothetical protein
MISVLRIMNRTTTVIVALIAAASLSTIVIGPQQQALAWHHHAAAAQHAVAAVAAPKGSWLTAPYGDSPDALFFCGAGLRQFTGVGAYGCGNGPEGGQVLPTSFLGGGCGGFGGGCGGCGGFGGGCGDGFFGSPFGWHRHVIQDTNQANNCQRGDGNGAVPGSAQSAAVTPAANNSTHTASASSGSEDQSDNPSQPQGGDNANRQTSCLNTGVNTAGHGFGGLGFGGPGLGQ